MDKKFKILCGLISGVVILAILVLMIIGIVNSNKTNTTSSSNTSKSSTSKNESQSNEVKEEKKMTDIDYAKAAEKQMSLPEKGEEIAIIKVKGFGTMKAKFFPEVAPKAVENFVTHSKEGYYNGLTFHIEDLYVWQCLHYQIV